MLLNLIIYIYEIIVQEFKHQQGSFFSLRLILCIVDLYKKCFIYKGSENIPVNVKALYMFYIWLYKSK